MEQKARNIVFERFKKIIEINSDKIIQQQERCDRLNGINVMSRKYYKNHYLNSVRDIIENLYYHLEPYKGDDSGDDSVFYNSDGESVLFDDLEPVDMEPVKTKDENNKVFKIITNYDLHPNDYPDIITLEMLEKNFEKKSKKSKRFQRILSKRIKIVAEVFEKYSDKYWDWDEISMNPNLTMEIIEKYLDKPWEWGKWGISKNPNITMEFIDKYSDKDWDWEEISYNPNLTIEFVDKYPDKDWDWYWGISKHPKLTMEFFEKYPDKNWYCDEFTNHPNFTIENVIEMISKFPNKPWDWDIISSHPNLTMEIVKTLPNERWIWNKITNHPNISTEIIENNPEQPWHWGVVSHRPDLTFDFIEKYIDKNWSWHGILTNFILFKTEYEKVLKFIKIEEELIAKTWHPSRFQEWCFDEDQKKENCEEEDE